MTTVALDWQGPFHSATMQHHALPAKRKSGVCLLIHSLDAARSVYLRSSKDIGSRLMQHIGNVLALGYYTREPSGEWYPTPSTPRSFWQRVGDLAEELARVQRVVHNMQLAWSETEPGLASAIERDWPAPVGVPR